MRHSKEYLSLSIFLGIALAVTGCVVNPSNQNSTPVDMPDLYNRSESDAVQQLRTRGFNQVGAKPASSTGIRQSWWLNLPTNQCVQLDITNRKVMKVMTINPESSQDCHNTR